MKLIAEVLDNEINYIAEENKDTGKKDYFIEGVFIQTEQKNKNGRIYRKSTMDKEIDRYTKEHIDKKRAYGELGHPQGPTINLERVSHMIQSLKPEGNNYIGRAKVMDTPYGSIVKNLMKEGAQLGVSSRGMGSLKAKKDIMEVQDDFMLATAADIVADPSAPDAFVKGVMEGCEWIYDQETGAWTKATINVVEEILDTGKKSAKELMERKVYLFQKYLDTLK
jgi:hypothetical protein|tara:strand:- start:155 stop:823 length:669 start_codon:yes stop_codon:yes gene_type:complete